MPEENALDRLMRESQTDDSEPKYSLDEMIDSEEDENILEKMSSTAVSSLKQKILPEAVVEEDEEEEIEVEEKQKVEPEKIEKVEVPKKQSVKKPQKSKKDKGTKLDEFMNSLANECIDIMIQSGVTIHNFNPEQMNIIWDYIKQRI